MDDFGDTLNFGNYVNDDDLLYQQPLGDGFDAACTTTDHIKTSHSPLPSYSTPYEDEVSPGSSAGSSRNSFDLSLARLTESPTSRKSSLTEAEAGGDDNMMSDAELSKSNWDPSFQFMDTTNSPLFPTTIDPSTIENGQTQNQQNGHADHHDSPLGGSNLFASPADGSSPPMMDKDSPSSNIFNFGAGDFQNYIPAPSLETLTNQNGRNMSTPFGAGQNMAATTISPSFDFSSTNGLPQVQPAGAEQLWNPGGDMRLFHGTMSSGHPMGIPMSAAPRLYGSGPHKLDIMLDSNKRKSRVETQLMIKLILSPLPPGIKKLHIPHITVGKPKLWAKPAHEPRADTLELHVSVVCTSAMQNPELKEAALERARQSAQTGIPIPYDATLDPLEQAKVGGRGGEVRICKNCVTREGKRAKRRKKVKSQEEDALWVQDEWERILLFNTNEIKDWVEPKAEDMKKGIGGFYFDTPMRITCYCRHHHEKSGFQVIFTITDWRGNFIAQEMSDVIMITDDHKTSAASPEQEVDSGEAELALQSQEMNGLHNVQSPVGINGSQVSVADSQPLAQKPGSRNLSRSASPFEDIGPSSKRRKPSSHHVPAGLQMTPVGNVSPTAPNQMSPLDMNAVAAASGFPPSAMQFSPSSAFHVPFGHQMSNPFGNAATPTAAQNTAMHNMVNGTANLENMGMPMYSAPTSTHPSRAPSPNGLRNSVSPISLPMAQPATMHNGVLFNAVPIRTVQPPADPLVIHKVIPGEGPKSGGIEVTVLGSGFTPGVSIMFGDVEAVQTTHWSPTCTVCMLPPSPIAGQVSVTLKGQTPDPQRPTAKFTYTNEDEAKLMRLALRILSNGKDEVVSRITRDIINYAATYGAGSGDMANGPTFNPGGNHTMNSMNLESDILKVLELIDLNESPRRGHLDLQLSTGHTMLHLAASMGLRRVVAGLLARGADPDMADKGGYTPLHLASLNNYTEIVRRLVACGADPALRTASGLTPRDVARSQDVVNVLPTESRATLPSSDLLHRRVRSATSLRSQWAPLSAPTAVAIQRMPTSDETTTDEDVGSDDSSLEPDSDSSSDNGEEADLAEEDGLELRGLSRRAARGVSSRPQSRPRKHVEPDEDHSDPDRPPSPAAAQLTALRDQFTAQLQTIQQAMALHFQSLPQFPFQSLPQFPYMPAPLTDYQQRLLAMMPALGGGGAVARPDSDSQSNKTTPAARWWDLSFKGSPATAAADATASAPPAYDELYPAGSSPSDTKQASAAAAAAEAEADQKCAALYDDVEVASASEEVESLEDSEECGESSTLAAPGPGPLPEVLQIPRRSAITKEHQDTLRQAHAIKVTWLRRDWKLWFIWMPALVVIMAFMLYNSASLGLGGMRAWGGWQDVKMVQLQHPVDAARAVGKFVQDTIVGEVAAAGQADSGQVGNTPLGGVPVVA
ncbi:hypothetical protein V8F20_005256 [Naviculisporaceae sp. PSN 640]